MLFEVSLARGDELQGDELETALFEAGDDGADESALDAIGLDHDVGAFSGDHCVNLLQAKHAFSIKRAQLHFSD